MSDLLGEPYLAIEWEHGLMCARCDHVFVEGDRYTQVLEAFQDDIPILLVICVSCALAAEVPS